MLLAVFETTMAKIEDDERGMYEWEERQAEDRALEYMAAERGGREHGPWCSEQCTCRRTAECPVCDGVGVAGGCACCGCNSDDETPPEPPAPTGDFQF